MVQPPRTVAVLPLVDLSPAGGNAYLGDGLAQELTARLTRIRGLRVAARTSAFAFRDRNTDVRTIAQTLGVRHIVEGSVLREGDHLRVTAQLVDSASGYTVWSQTYDRTWQDLLAIEDDLTRSIMGALQVVLTSDIAQRVTQAPTTHLAAFDRYLTGLARLHDPSGAAQLEQAEESFRQALAEDPQFALAYAGLCQRYAMGYEQTRDAALVGKAEAACNQALKLDDSLREVSGALGHLYLVSGRNAQAEAIFREAVTADPDDADGYTGLGEALDGQRRSADAERAFRQAIEVEPSYWGAQTALGNFLFRHGRFVAAAPLYRRVTELIPASPTSSERHPDHSVRGGAARVRKGYQRRRYRSRFLKVSAGDDDELCLHFRAFPARHCAGRRRHHSPCRRYAGVRRHDCRVCLWHFFDTPALHSDGTRTSMETSDQALAAGALPIVGSKGISVVVVRRQQRALVRLVRMQKRPGAGVVVRYRLAV